MPALQASHAAIQAALVEHLEVNILENLASNEKREGSRDPLEPGEIEKVNMDVWAETIRTVFSDSKNFNVKASLVSSHYVCLWEGAVHRTRSIHLGPSTFPQTPLPQMPSVAAAMGWMEDIKCMINFDSMEEFWR
ncbi:hypothetical protein EW146_g5670 [Bondarzewia mesenterica]|uniref:Uncharacterized protein n=1 Tax=Bondarzewia mesenterica TaxID=1095465 RepID=A0A4S4LSN1_9AGAM|nr:hypothetical protein EW146_g5670 [Bondarzewia mesenterica]